MESGKHSINVINPEKHGGEGLNNSYISYELFSIFVNIIVIMFEKIDTKMDQNYFILFYSNLGGQRASSEEEISRFFVAS